MLDSAERAIADARQESISPATRLDAYGIAILGSLDLVRRDPPRIRWRKVGRISGNCQASQNGQTKVDTLGFIEPHQWFIGS